MKRVSPGRIALAVAVAGGVGLSAWSLRYFRRYQPLADLMAGPGGADQVGLEVDAADVTGRVGGRRRWRVSARRITFSQDQRQVSVDGLHHGVLFDEHERPLALLSAGSVLYQSSAPVFGDGPQGFLQVGGGLRVRLLGRYGPVVSAAGLSWDPVQSVLRSVAPVSALFPADAGAVGGAQILADSVQWDARRGLLQSPGRVQVVFATGTGTAVGENVLVDLHTSDLTLYRLHGTFALPHVVKQTMAQRYSHAAPLLAGLILTAPPLGAAPAPPSPAAPAHYVTYDAGAATWLDAPRTAQMSQGVKFNQDDAWLETQSAVVNLDDQQHALNAESRAPVHLWDSQNDLTGQHGFIDFTKHVATIKDSITLVVKPGAQNTGAPPGSLRSKFKDPATMTCALMTYDYRRKYGTVPGPLTIRQKDRVLTADHGTYDGRAQIVTLTGHVHGHDGEDQISAPEVLFGVREGDEVIRIDQHVHGIFKQRPDDGTDDAPPAPVDPNAYDAFKNGGPASAAPALPAAAAPVAAPAPDNGGAGSAPGPGTPVTPPTASAAPPSASPAPASPAPPSTGVSAGSPPK